MTHSSFSTCADKALSTRIVTRRQLLTATTFGIGALALPALAKPEANLQAQLRWLIKRQRREGLLSRYERTSWSVYDFQSNKKLVAINEDHPMQAASMIKVFVALAYFYLNSQAPRQYPYGYKERRLMERMLVKSDNEATNRLMRMCKGPANVKRLCQQATKNRFRQLRIVEYIPAGGRTYRNKVSAHDYSRFLYDLWYGRLPHSFELKRIMAIKNHDRITTDIMHSNVRVFDKTGSTSRLCGNIGIVEFGYKKAYTFVGVIERSYRSGSYTNWINDRSDAMREASTLVYRFMRNRYR